MGFHTYDADRAPELEDPWRFAYLSVDELLALFEPESTDEIADLGSGTGFYTDEVAPYVETVHAVDVQAEMHGAYEEKGVPENVELVTAEVADLPLADDALDAAVSTMTFHEFATEEALTGLTRVLGDGGRLAVGDWSAAGEGREGPPRSERYDATDATKMLEAAGFTVERAEDRRETFVASARL
ncbi:MAG: class I SAM-dependent methyltransferase [Haloarculaceae archaeon]